MKKITFPALIFALLLAVMTVSAQRKATDFTANWELNVAKSKLPDAAKVESMTVKVSQTAKDLTVETTVKRISDASRGGIGGGMRRGGNNEATQTVIYNLDGKETVADIGSGIMAGSEARTAKAVADGKLSLTTTRKFTSEMGGAATKSNETWELLDGGKTLKITRYVETPRGGINSEMYFTKKLSGAENKSKTVESSDQTYLTESDTLNGGIMNGKTTAMPSPEYPVAARAVRASGAVNVQVTVDEKGNVISVNAVSGHPLLRKAAEQAARKAKFSTNGFAVSPIKVTGILVYNFAL